jgi:hypothetical protein
VVDHCAAGGSKWRLSREKIKKLLKTAKREKSQLAA